jgi:hypothetical protein
MSEPRRVTSVHINPVNGTIVGLCDDGTVWIHDGSPANHSKPWKRLNDASLQDLPPPPKEDESVITTVV